MSAERCAMPRPSTGTASRNALRTQLCCSTSPCSWRISAGCATPPRKLHVQAIVAGGASLKRHWNAGLARHALAEARWDYVVLQEQSTLPVKNPQRYQDNLRLFAPEIANIGARIVLYLTWSRESV